MTQVTSPATNTLAGVSFHTLTGPEFERATQGEYRSDSPSRQPWLAHPKLKYFAHRSALHMHRGEGDRRTFFLATVVAQPAKANGARQPTTQCIGIIELEVSPYRDDEMWLKYVTVEPGYQGRGIATELVRQMTEHLKGTRYLLSRSTATEAGSVWLQGHLDRVLDAAGVRWRQSGRERAA